MILLDSNFTWMSVQALRVELPLKDSKDYVRQDHLLAKDSFAGDLNTSFLSYRDRTTTRDICSVYLALWIMIVLIIALVY